MGLECCWIGYRPEMLPVSGRIGNEMICTQTDAQAPALFIGASCLRVYPTRKRGWRSVIGAFPVNS
jgi:hypothetical protein